MVTRRVFGMWVTEDTTHMQKVELPLFLAFSEAKREREINYRRRMMQYLADSECENVQHATFDT